MMEADPFDGAIYVFRAKRADRVKLVFWDGTGVCLFAKRLEDGDVSLAEDRGRRDASVGGAALGAAGRARLAAGAASPRSTSADVARLTCGEVNQGAAKSSQIRRKYGVVAGMTQAADALPDDPETLKAMLIAERIRSERLVQIIKELQRHRFGRRAETLPADQLLLALEDVEQSEAETAARGRGEVAGRARGGDAQAARQPRRVAAASAAHRDRSSTSRARLARAVGANFTGSVKTSARSSTSFPPSSGCLVVRRPKYACRDLRGRGGPSPGASAADRGWPADRGDGRPRAGRQIRRSPAALSPGADLRAPGNSVSIARRSPTGSAAPPSTCGRSANASSPTCSSSDETVRRRDDGAGARSRPRTHQDRPTLGLCQRRSTLGRNGPAGGRLRLCARPEGVAADRASWPASRAFSRSTATPATARSSKRATSASPSAGRTCAVASTNSSSPTPRRSPARRCNASRRSMPIEKDIRGCRPAATPRRPPGALAPNSRRTRTLAARQAPAHQPEEQARRGDPLCAVALGRPQPLPRRRPDRDRFQHGRAFDPPDRNACVIVRPFLKYL